MSELSVHAGLRLLVEAGAMIHFQLEPRSAVHVFGQDQTHLLHSKLIFSTPADLPKEDVSSSDKTLAVFVEAALAS